MKITAVIGAIPGNDYNSSGILKIIYETMAEIGETINIYNLVEQNLPYASASFEQGVFTQIEQELSSSDGVIFITTSNLFAPCAIMQNFLEYFSKPIYKNTLQGKNCMLVAVSNSQEVGSTIDYLSKVTNYLGGYDSVKIPLSYSLTKNISDEDKLLIEKYTEDFYRYVKQHRRFFTVNDSINKNPNQIKSSLGSFTNQNKQPVPVPAVFETVDINSASNQIPPNRNKIADLYENNSINNFHKTQEDDILEITKSLSDRLNKKPEEPNNQYIQNGNRSMFNMDLTNVKVDDLAPRTLNARQMTQNLTHYFQPQIADGLVCDVSLNITGDEGFDGVISIDKHICSYKDGVYQNSDIIITATDDIWKQIVKGTTTAQRAFMTGQIKVRGNFVLLPKFDSLFKR